MVVGVGTVVVTGAAAGIATLARAGEEFRACAGPAEAVARSSADKQDGARGQRSDHRHDEELEAEQRAPLLEG